MQGFLYHGADPNTRDLDGYTPLLNYVSGYRAEPRIVDLLLRAGACETLVDVDIDAASYVRLRGSDGDGYEEDKVEVLQLLTNAPIDRRWRRRALIVMCIARHNRDFVPVEPIVVSANDTWSRVAAWLLEMGTGAAGTDGIFRSIVGYLLVQASACVCVCSLVWFPFLFLIPICAAPPMFLCVKSTGSARVERRKCDLLQR